jgi:hypothetical protein
MNKTIGLLLISILACGGCKKEEVGISFNLDYTASATIKSGSILNLPLDFFTPDITTNSEAEFAANDTRKDKVIRAELTSMNLKVTAPEGKTFSFLKHIYFYINADGLDEARVAFKEDVASTESVIQLNVESVDLAEYIKKDKYSLRLECVTRETINQDIDVSSDMTFRVKANPLK